MNNTLSFNEEELFEIEKKIIKRYKDFKHLSPRKIRVLDMDDKGCFDVSTNEIHMSNEFLKTNPSRKEVENLLKHELIHCLYPKYGHSIEFLQVANRLHITSDYENRQLFREENKTMLEGRIIKEVNPEGIEEIKIRRKPSWKGFKEMVEDSGISVGEGLRKLRECYDLSIDELAMRIGVNDRKILQIEDSRDFTILYTQEKILKIIFRAIVKKQ